MERYVERRGAHLGLERARVREKIEVQQHEREQVWQRQSEMPPVSFGRYVRFLLRLGAWRT